MGERLEAVRDEHALAVAEAKPKRAEKLEAQLAGLSKRHAHVKEVEPVSHPLKHEARIKELHAAIVPLVKLEAQPGLRSMAEMKKIGLKPEYEDEIERLEEESRGWFEEDAEFAARCALVKAAAAAKANRASGAAKKKAAADAKKRPEDQWETVGSMGSAPRQGRR